MATLGADHFKNGIELDISILILDSNFSCLFTISWKSSVEKPVWVRTTAIITYRCDTVSSIDIRTVRNGRFELPLVGAWYYTCPRRFGCRFWTWYHRHLYRTRVLFTVCLLHCPVFGIIEYILYVTNTIQRVG